MIYVEKIFRLFNERYGADHCRTYCHERRLLPSFSAIDIQAAHAEIFLRGGLFE